MFDPMMGHLASDVKGLLRKGRAFKTTVKPAINPDRPDRAFEVLFETAIPPDKIG